MKTSFAALKYLEKLSPEMQAIIKESLPEGIEVANVERKGLEIKAEGESKTFSAILSSSSLDRDHEVVLPQGINTKAFAKNPVLLWMHNWNLPPVGSVSEYDQDEKRFKISAAMGDTAFSNDLWTLIKGGHLRSMSIGFMPVETWFPGDKAFDKWAKDNSVVAPNTKRVYAKTILLEASLVTIPANTDAIITSAKNFDAESLKALNIELPKEEPVATLYCRLVKAAPDEARLISDEIAEILDIRRGRV